MSEENEKLAEGESVETEIGQESVGGEKPSFLQDSTQTSEAITEESAAEETEVKIPEKFQGKSAEEIIQSYQNLESLQGKQATLLSESRARVNQLEDKLTHLSELLQAQRQTSQQSSQNPDKGAEENVDLNELFLEKGADVVAEVVRREIGEVLTERDRKQLAENEAFLQTRDKEIEAVAQAEVSIINDEIEGGIPAAVLNQMAYIDRTDPELDRLRNDPNLTPEIVRQKAREVYERAVREIQEVAGKVGDNPTKEQIEAYNKATKKAAKAAPGDTAKGAETGSSSDPRIERMKEIGWGFLAERS